MKILTVIFCLLPALSWSEVIEVTGHEGQDVTVQCSHSWASTNWKYFCKGQCSSGDVLIKTEEGQRNKTNGRFSMYDEATGTFWVTITGLKKTDTGTYWCAVDRFIKDTFTEVHLTVLDASRPTAPPPDTSASNWGGGQTTAPHPGTPSTVPSTVPDSTAPPLAIAESSQDGTQSTESVSSTSENLNMDHTGHPGNAGGVENDYDVQINRAATEPVMFHEPPDRLTVGLAKNDPIHQNHKVKCSQKDSFYENVHTNTFHKCSLYKSLNSNTLKKDCLYDTLSVTT